MEDWGVDFLWAARGRWFGVQRKALKDLVASAEGERLAKERLQWPSLDVCFLVIETGERGGGAPREMPGGQLVGLGTFGRPWTGAALRSLIYTLMDEGVRVVWTMDEAETLARVQEIQAWSMKERHLVSVRPAAPRNVFGERGNREYGVWLLSSLPGVGPETAGKIWDRFGLPFHMTVGMEDLTTVPGVGKVTAKRIMEVFDGSRSKDSV